MSTMFYVKHCRQARCADAPRFLPSAFVCWVSLCPAERLAGHSTDPFNFPDNRTASIYGILRIGLVF